MDRNEELVRIGDADRLTDRIDELCHDADWPLVVDLRDRCRAALSRGKQLWPAAAYADYRLALDAPGAFAVAVLDATSERFAPGPFAEVIASTHRFRDLAPLLGHGPSTCALAHECVLRGEDLRAYEWLDGPFDPFAMPFQLASWEPAYTLPVYEPSRLRADTPPIPAATQFASIDSGDRAAKARRLSSEAETEAALAELTTVWKAQSNGTVDVITVEGDASDAIAALGCRRHRRAEVPVALAIDGMAWAGASGGAHGRRRGMAAGRHGALWTLLHLAGVAEPDLDVTLEVLDDLGEVLPELRFHLWDDGAPPTGWSLRLAVEDVQAGLAWAIAASDARL